MNSSMSSSYRVAHHTPYITNSTIPHPHSHPLSKAPKRADQLLHSTHMTHVQTTSISSRFSMLVYISYQHNPSSWRPLCPPVCSCAPMIVLCLQTRTCGPERSLNDPNVSSFGMNPAKPEWLLIFIVCEWSIQKYIRYWNHCCLGYCMF